MFSQKNVHNLTIAVEVIAMIALWVIITVE